MSHFRPRPNRCCRTPFVQCHGSGIGCAVTLPNLAKLHPTHRLHRNRHPNRRAARVSFAWAVRPRARACEAESRRPMRFVLVWHARAIARGDGKPCRAGWDRSAASLFAERDGTWYRDPPVLSPANAMMHVPGAASDPGSRQATQPGWRPRSKRGPVIEPGPAEGLRHERSAKIARDCGDRHQQQGAHAGYV